jgi:hypothetical protein
MKKPEKRPKDTGSEPRTILDQYRSVEFSVSKTDPVFQFRVRDVSPSGMGILSKQRIKGLGISENGAGVPHEIQSGRPERFARRTGDGNPAHHIH